MFKRQTRLLILCLCLSLGLLSYSHAFLNIGGLLESAVEKYEREGTLGKLPGKAGVSSLFKNSLKEVKGRDMKIIDDSISVVVDKLNNDRGTNLNQQDVVNMLYYVANYGNLANTIPLGLGNNIIYARDFSFRNMIDQASEGKNISKPSVDDRNASCRKFINQLNGTNGNFALSLENQQFCANTVRDAYLSAVLVNRSVSLLDSSYGEEVFLNASLDDSDYDLMVDIANIGKILFDSYIPPVELVFFNMPSFDRAISSDSAFSSMDVDEQLYWLERFASLPDDLDVDLNYLELFDEILIDADKQFIQNLNHDLQNDGQSSDNIGSQYGLNLSYHDMCVDLDIIENDFPMNEPDEAILDVDVYIDFINRYNDIVQRNNSNNVLLDDRFVLGGGNDTDDVQNRVARRIDDQLDLAMRMDMGSIEACVDSCQGLSSWDKAACVASCYCSEVGSSPQYVGGFEILLEDAFRIRFCTVPPSSVAVTKGRRIYSIEEIIDEMRNIFVSLKNSGELFKHEKTKEFLNFATSRNRFSDMFAFNLQLGFKSVSDHTPAVSYKIEQEQINKSLEARLTRMGGELSQESQRNKYLVLANPSVQKSIIQSDPSLTRFNEQLTYFESYSASWEGIESNIDLDILQSKNFLVNQSFMEFLNNNMVFWDNMIGMFSEFKDIAEDLRSKMK